MLTHKQIEAAAKKSRKTAIACTQKHWEQMRDAPLEKLRQGEQAKQKKLSGRRLLKKQTTLYYSNMTCALCLRYEFQCSDECKLWGGNSSCGDSSKYKKAQEAHVDYILIGKGRAKWQRAAQKVIDRIKWLK